MAVVMDDKLKEKLEYVKKREWWPVALLADILGKPRMYVYRKIEKGDFNIIQSISAKRVTTESVLRFFSEKR